MPSESQIFPEFPADDPQDFAAGLENSPGFPEKVGGSSTPLPPAPLRPGACSTEACDPLNPRACPSEAYPGELMPGNIPDHFPIHTQVICVRIRLALKSPLPRSIPLLASLPAIPCLFPAFLFVPPVRLASPAVRPVRQPLRLCSLIRCLDRTLFP